MSTKPFKDRASLCSFTFTDGRRCHAPRRDGHSYLRAFHARKKAQAPADEEAGQDIAFFLAGDDVSAGDPSFALGRVSAALAPGQVKPKTATILASLGQTLVQILPKSRARDLLPLPKPQKDLSKRAQRSRKPDANHVPAAPNCILS